MAWVVTDCMNGACGMERMETTEARAMLKCMIGMEVKCSIRGQREERTQLRERNGAKMEIIYCKHMDKQITTCFLFSAQLMGGGEILRSSGSLAGKALILCGYYT